MKRKMIGAALAGVFTISGIACSGSTGKSADSSRPAPPSASSAASPDTVASTANHGATATDEVPELVRAALSGAQTVTTQHRDVSAAQIAEIEKETGTKISDPDHHTYLAFSTSGGVRKQTGAATLVEADGKQLVVIYESRDGVPYIKEVRAAEAAGIPPAFLNQFKGKGHDDKLQIGADLTAQGVDEATAKAAAAAVRRDTRIMQALYGAEHTH